MAKPLTQQIRVSAASADKYSNSDGMVVESVILYRSDCWTLKPTLLLDANCNAQVTNKLLFWGIP